MPTLTRRQIAQSLLLAAAPSRAAAHVLESDALRLEVSAREEGGVERLLVNKLSNETIRLPCPDYLFEFEGGAAIASTDSRVKIERQTRDRLSLRQVVPRGALAGLEVEVRYTLPPGKAYFRKEISLRKPKGPPARLLRADLDIWDGVKRSWRSMRADQLPYGSHPIYCETLWAGVEFVAAFNQYSSAGFVLRSRPGARLIGSDWVHLNPTAAGVARPDAVRDAFLRYIEDIRLAPARLVACYNSWWTLPIPMQVNGEDLLALARRLKENLHGRHGVFFDIFTTDGGWSDRQSIWEVDRKNLPNGFRDLRAIVESAGGKLGLWMSPSEVYAPFFDYEWGEKNGYTVLTNKARPRHWQKAVSLADPKYRERTLEQLQRLIRDNGFAHIKFDGFAPREVEPHHGLLPGDDSVEPLAEHSLELIRATRKANPNLVTEPTYLNSLSNYISPWILKYSDTVWGNAGGDCPLGLAPAPDYRESHTTTREYYIFSSLNEVWLPQDALHYFDIVHCDDSKGFPNHAAMAFGRGRFFVSTYLNPKFMNEDDWRVYAGLLQWARRNQDLLRNTVILPSRVELGEPYAYAHWLGARGIIAVRNPSNETREYVLDFRACRAPQALTDAVCYTQFPYRRGLATGLTSESRLPLRLAPWELVFLEVIPRTELRETVVIGGRWYEAPGGGLMLSPDWDTSRVRVLTAGGESEQPVPARSRGKAGGEVIARSTRKLAPGEWFSVKDKPLPTFGFELGCSVTVPDSAQRAKVLLLVQFPGREHWPSRCAATVNGKPATLAENSSEKRTGYYGATPDSSWKDVIPFESEWTWYLCDAGRGTSTLQFTGAAADPRFRLGLWLWVDSDCSARQIRLTAACGPPEMPQYDDRTERHGVCLLWPC